MCLDALGMQNRKISNSAITASSEYSTSSKAIYGRLHFLFRSGINYGAWSAKTNDVFQYLQINFGDWTKVTRVAIQGRQDANQWVKSYSLSYGYDAAFFKYYYEDGEKKVISLFPPKFEISSESKFLRYLRLLEIRLPYFYPYQQLYN